MDARAEFLAQLHRTKERLRSMTAAQIERDDRVTQVRAMMLEFIDETHPGLSLPVLQINALGDQLFVLGRECADRCADAKLEALASNLLELRKNL